MSALSTTGKPRSGERASIPRAVIVDCFVDDEEYEHSVGPGTTIALIGGLIVFYGLFIAVALARG